jgi:iron complex outermembrane receptor protein
VRLVELARRARVDSLGAFLMEGLPPGSYLVEATSPRWGRATERAEVENGRVARILLELDPLYRLDELVISVGPGPTRRSETYQPTSALSGRDLDAAAQSSLGETLTREPGVNSSYYGPGSSRPVIRGMGGDRVRILESGIGSGDVSNQGPDHAVSLEPLAAERIEIVRSPATLLYGSTAVGGVVNVIDKRIPKELPSGAVDGSVTLLGGTVADERTGALELNGHVGSVAWHVSGLRRYTGDYSIPGFAEHQHEDHEGEGHAGEGEEAFGILENSAVETNRGAMGMSWVGQSGHWGVAVSGLDTEYGVPGHGHGEHQEEEGVRIGMKQRRVDAEGTWRLSGDLLRSVQARFGYGDYEHTEFEGAEVGTRFTNENWEARLEAEHQLDDPLFGAVGVQLGGRDFAAFGEEAFVPPSEYLSFAAFAYEELRRESVRFQVGARLESQQAQEKVAGIDEAHVGISVSTGLNWTLSDRVSVALSGARSMKIPTLEELFANGPHASTFAYEIGDPNLGVETAYSVDATLHLTEGRLRGEVTGFANRFQDYIYQETTGGIEDGLPVYRTGQRDAAFMGAEAALEFDLVHRGRQHVLVEGWGDYVRAELVDDDQPLPRIPPLRLGGGVRYDGGVIRADLGMTWVFDQKRVAALEEETEGYAMLDGSIGYRLFVGEWAHDLVLVGRNLTDADARNHVSFLKELAPLPGREVRLMYRFFF